MITLKLGDPLWKVVGDKSLKVELNGSHTIADALAEVNRLFPGFLQEAQRGEFDLPYNIFVNDTLVHWDKITCMPLKDGDKLYLFMAVSGG